MTPLVQVVNNILSVLTVVGQVLFVVWFVSFFILKKAPWAGVLREKTSEVALKGAWVVALIATLGSLFYSEIAHFTPCLLCWYQRIFMYPQVILLGLAILKKDAGIALYSLVLSIIGAFLAGYHYLLQLGITPAPCAAVGYSSACSERFVMTFGYITIPMMAFTAFLLLIACMITVRRKL